jgi:hypothetical protein
VLISTLGLVGRSSRRYMMMVMAGAITVHTGDPRVGGGGVSGCNAIADDELPSSC